MKRVFPILLAMTLAAALFAGCGKTTTDAHRTTMAASTPGGAAAPQETQPPTGALGPLTKDIFAVYTEGGTYHVKHVGPMAGGGELTEDIYAKGGSLAWMYPDSPDDYRAVIRDGWFYEVNDAQKTARKIPLEEIAGYPVPPDSAALRYVGSGRADFKGEELDYDEYSHAAGFRALYFVKDGVLKGIRYTEDGMADIEWEYLVFEAEAPDSVFGIPADYTELKFP